MVFLVKNRGMGFLFDFSVLFSIVNLLIEKGIITEEEYEKRVKNRVKIR
jgi:hypothetical protein